jgi:hypothetical protein
MPRKGWAVEIARQSQSARSTPVSLLLSTCESAHSVAADASEEIPSLQRPAVLPVGGRFFTQSRVFSVSRALASTAKCEDLASTPPASCPGKRLREDKRHGGRFVLRLCDF